MPTPTVPVTVTLAAQDGTPYVGVTVRARLDRNDVYEDGADGSVVIADQIEAVTDADGVAILDCFPNAIAPDGLGTLGTIYSFRANIPGGRHLNVQALVPNAACRLEDILTNVSAAEQEVLAASASAGQAASSAAAAAASAASAADSAAAAASASAMSLDGYTALRAFAGSETRIYITGYLVTQAPSGVAGLFVRDDVDVTSADDGGTIIVDSLSRRWKRQYEGRINARWFGLSESNGGGANATAMQKFVDCLESFSRPRPGAIDGGSYNISSTVLFSKGVDIEGTYHDIGRSGATWGAQPCRFLWTGVATDNMFEIASGGVRGGRLKGIVFDGGSTLDVYPLYAGSTASNWTLENCCFRMCHRPCFVGQSCFGWVFRDVELFNNYNIGIALDGLNHNTSFYSLRSSGNAMGAYTAQSVVRIGENGLCSNINFFGCDFEQEATTYFIELMSCRAVNISGGYMEVAGNMTAPLRLGVTATTKCYGFTMQGVWVQGNGTTHAVPYALDIKNAEGVEIGGGCFFNNIDTAVVNCNSAACPNSRFSPATILADVGGAGNKVKFANLSTGWSFHDSGTTAPTIVGTGGAANSYTTQKCQWWVRDGRCFFDAEITLSALNSTGPLQVETSIPYTAASNYDYACQVVSYTGLTLAAGSHLRAFVIRGTNDINLREQIGTGTGENTVLNTEATATMSLKVSGNFPISPAP